jgi:large subunit ribosomal protein L21
MMFAVIRVNGKQYRVQDGTEILVDQIAAEPGSAYEAAEVLVLGEGASAQVGTPVVSGAKVAATIVRHAKGEKIRVFKYKAKKNYRRRIGARAHHTLLRIDSISA